MNLVNVVPFVIVALSIASAVVVPIYYIVSTGSAEWAIIGIGMVFLTIGSPLTFAEFLLGDISVNAEAVIAVFLFLLQFFFVAFMLHKFRPRNAKLVAVLMILSVIYVLSVFLMMRTLSG